MSEFLEYVLWKFQNSLVLVLLVGFVALKPYLDKSLRFVLFAVAHTLTSAAVYFV